MKNKYTIIAIIVSWTSFLTWEYFVHQWVKRFTDFTLRVDLIILFPALIMLTLWGFLKNRKD